MEKLEHGLTFYSPDKQVKYRTKAKILSIITLHIEKNQGMAEKVCWYRGSGSTNTTGWPNMVKMSLDIGGLLILPKCKFYIIIW